MSFLGFCWRQYKSETTIDLSSPLMWLKVALTTTIHFSFTIHLIYKPSPILVLCLISRARASTSALDFTLIVSWSISTLYFSIWHYQAWISASVTALAFYFHRNTPLASNYVLWIDHFDPVPCSSDNNASVFLDVRDKTFQMPSPPLVVRHMRLAKKPWFGG